MDTKSNKIQLKTNNGLIFYGDLKEMDSSKITINNTSFMIEGKSDSKYNYINKLNLSREASFERKDVIWLSEAY